MKKLIAITLTVVLVLSLSLVTAVPAMAATDYYVATDGSDAFGDGTQTWVDNDSSTTWSAGDTGPWLTIQHAIDQATSSDTIIVANGTYTESLLVNKADLTLRSVSGAASTTITNAGNVSGTQTGIALRAGADDFVLGATGQGFTIDGGTAGRLIELINAPAGVEISHNVIDSRGSAFMGISVGAAGATDLTITDNTFYADVGDGSIWGPEVVNIDVSDNTFNGPGAGTVSGYAIQFSGVTATSPSIIDGNTITGYGFGILISNGEGTSDLQITNNSISECKKGISFYDYVQSGHTAGDMTDVTVACNTMEKNTVGLYISAGTHVKADTFVVLYNNFVGNTLYGLQNNNALTVTAEANWWGSVGDPSGAIDGLVDYEPWSFTPDPCETKTIGFWKTHPDSTEAVYDLGPLVLGSQPVTFAEVMEILKNAKAKNAYDMLAAQLIAAKLNRLHLTHISVPCSSSFDGPIAAADAWLIAEGYYYPNFPKPSKADKGTVNGLKGALDDVNNTGCLCTVCM